MILYLVSRAWIKLLKVDGIGGGKDLFLESVADSVVEGALLFARLVDFFDGGALRSSGSCRIDRDRRLSWWFDVGFVAG